MVKTIDQRKFHRKNKRIRRIFKRIKIIKKSKIRKSSSDSTFQNSQSYVKNLEIEAKNNINLSLNNAVYSYVNKISGKNDQELTQNIFIIINNLSMNMNIFTIWTMLIEDYNKSYELNWDYETMFYIGLVAKEKFNPDFTKNIKEKIDPEKLIIMKSILDHNQISFKEMNQRIKDSNSTINIMNKKSVYIDYESMVNFICDEKDKKDQKKKPKNAKNNIEENDEKISEGINIQDMPEVQDNIMNNENIDEDDNDQYADDDEVDANIPLYGLFDHENEKLPCDEIYEKGEKSEDSFHENNFRQTFKELGYIH